MAALSLAFRHCDRLADYGISNQGWMRSLDRHKSWLLKAPEMRQRTDQLCLPSQLLLNQRSRILGQELIRSLETAKEFEFCSIYMAVQPLVAKIFQDMALTFC